jgi:uncharacterized protein (DUF1501 family)
MNVTRRYFLKSSAALAAYCGVTPLRLLADAGLDPQNLNKVQRGKTLVVIFLRGGMDGLNFVVPFNDPGYYKSRRAIALPQPGKPDGVVDLNGFFGLHPKAAALAPLFAKGHAVALQAVGYDRNTRSHFEEQDTWETGASGNTISSDGWLNRHLLTSQGHGPIRAVSIGDALPRILRGPAPAFSVRGITDLGLFPEKQRGAEAAAQSRIASALEHAYCCDPRIAAAAAAAHQDSPILPGADDTRSARELLSQTAQTTFEGIEQLRAITSQSYTPAAKYPDIELGRRLEQVARLIKSNIGLEVAEVDYGSWDTHQNQGGATQDGGNYGRLVSGLAESLAAFATDLENHLDDVLVVTLSDFGRTAAENGTGGTDHGWANCMLAIGGPVLQANGAAPRNVIGRWPGLLPEQLHEKRDLLHTTDFRDVLGEIVAKHLGNPNIRTILPSHDFKDVGLIS